MRMKCTVAVAASLSDWDDLGQAVLAVNPDAGAKGRGHSWFHNGKSGNRRPAPHMPHSFGLFALIPTRLSGLSASWREWSRDLQARLSSVSAETRSQGLWPRTRAAQLDGEHRKEVAQYLHGLSDRR